MVGGGGSRFTHHLLVCTNSRPSGGKPSCGPRGGTAVLQALQEELMRRPALWSHVAITPCGCLGPCFDGPTVVVYPEGVWYAGVKATDAAAIIGQHIEGGRPVERLLYRWPEGGE